MSATSLTGYIRPVNPRHDLTQIADLIELCFAPQMDEDGRDYLRYIRRTIRDPHLQRWVRGSNEWVSTPLYGYVWEEDGQIIGNLSLIPFQYQSGWRYMVANIATRPEYRGRGIARRLTQKGIEHARQVGASAVWLQVRDDNPAAYNLYLQSGFCERARRSTWQVVESLPLLNLDEVKITRRKPAHWPLQSRWLRQIYPSEVAWNLNFNLNRFKPGLLNEIVRFFNNDQIEQWSVYLEEKLAGVAIWDAGVNHSETVWVAPDPDCEEKVLAALLTLLRQIVMAPRPIQVNYPAGRGLAAFTSAGFRHCNTQIWMEIPFRSSQ